MATKNRTRVSPATTANSKALQGIAQNLAAKAAEQKDPPASDEPAAEEEDEIVMVSAPRAFNLTLDNGTVKEYGSGGQRMPRSHAEHWYAKANGVEIVK